MTLTELSTLARIIHRNLKVTTAAFPLARTEKGVLEIRFTKDIEGFELVLDSVPLRTQSTLEDDYNIALKSGVIKVLGSLVLDSVGTSVPFSGEMTSEPKEPAPEPEKEAK